MRNPGRENICKSDQFPERFGSFAPPEETVVEWADSLPAGARALDIGRGVGRHVVYLGQRGLRMAGCDISLSGMRRAYAACVYRQVPFDGRVCSMSALPWPDAFFDAALSTSTIHHGLRSEIQQALAEIWRVLKPGGTLLVDFSCADTWYYQNLREAVRNGEMVEVEPNTFVDQRPQPEESDANLPHHYSNEAEARDLLQRFILTRI